MRFFAPRSVAAVLLLALLPLAPRLARADDDEKWPPFRNPALNLLPMDKAYELRMAPKMLGKPPTLSADDWEEINDGDVVVRKVAQHGDAVRYEAIGVVDGTPKEVADFMRDYSLRDDVMPHCEDVKWEWDKNLAKVDLTLSIAWKTIRYRLHLLHYGDSYVEWEYAYGDIKDTNGSYKFFPHKGGKKTLVVYNVYTDTGMSVPGWIQNLLTKSSLPDVIEAVEEGVKLRRKKK